MSIEPPSGHADKSAGKLPNPFRIGRSQVAYNSIPEMWWMLAAQFVTLVTLLIVVVVI